MQGISYALWHLVYETKYAVVLAGAYGAHKSAMGKAQTQRFVQLLFHRHIYNIAVVVQYCKHKALGGGNNKYTGDLLCSDGSHVCIYDMSTLAFGTGGLAPTNESISFNTFQLKYADIKTINHQITYNIYWFQTFKSVDDVMKYITDVDGLSYEVKK